MVNVNLIPDIKQERLKTRRVKRLVLGSATLAGIIGLGVPLLLFITIAGQKALINSQQDKIDDNTAQLKEIEDLASIVTVENNMSALLEESDQGFHLPKFLNNAMPKFVTNRTVIEGVEFDMTAGELELFGEARTVSDVHTMVELMRNTKAAPAESDVPESVFSSVTVNHIDRDTESAKFSVIATVNTNIFERQQVQINADDTSEVSHE